MTSGRTSVNFNALSVAQQDIQVSWNSITQQAQDLRDFVKRFADSWDGTAATQYHQLQAQWDAQMNDMASILQKIGTAVTVANDNYMATERSNKSTFEV